jgi:DNA polymerase III epsilon subunit-like protein
MQMIIFDLETTGISPTANDIIQIAAVRVSFGVVVRSEAIYGGDLWGHILTIDKVGELQRKQ